MRFALLGPLTVLDDAGVQVTPAGARQRSLLAWLLARANTPVSYDVLIDAVWSGRRASAPPTMVRSAVMRLRHALGPGPAARIVAQPPGYLIRVGESELDMLEFEALYRESGDAVRAGDWHGTARLTAQALALWRGEPMVDAPDGTLREQVVARLERLRVEVLADSAQAELNLGQHERVVPRLRDLTADHPLSERFHTQLMLALARSGRQAEALAAYRDARRVLVDELGIEPGPELRHLQQRILAGDPGLLVPSTPRLPGTAAVAPRPSEVPRQLPAGLGHFVGRADELKALSALLVQRVGAAGGVGAGNAGGAVVISAIDGRAGIGKTTLAVHWAHQVADRFPDGQLYVNLRGFDPSGTPMPPSEAVRRFLGALGVPARRIPADPEEQVALYRSELAGRRMLLVLDNARSVEQVRPLLPGSPGSLVLLTSRNRLAELVAVDGAVPLTLDLLTRHEARDLLIGRLGGERVLAAERTATELADLCARLPLALNIAAAHAALHPARALSHLVEELRDTRRRLDTLAIGGGAADVRTVFSWSYRALSPQAARAFRQLSLYPGPDISLLAVVDLTGLGLAATRLVLHELTAAHLIAEHNTGRYSFHDLLRAYATERARTEDTDTERHDATRRICDFYLHTAHNADRVLHPYRPPVQLDPPTGAAQHHLPADVPAALVWLEAEHANVLAAQRVAAELHWHSLVWQLAWSLSTFHIRRGHRHDELTAWQAALQAVAHLPDLVPRIRAHRLIGRAYAELGSHQDAIGHLNHALALAAHHDDLREKAHTHRTLAWAWERRGDARQALHHATRARDLDHALDQPTWEAYALNQMGLYTARLGEYDTARAHCETALVLHRRHQDPTGIAETALTLGYLQYRTGHHLEAVDHYQEAVALFRSIGNTFQAADALDGLGHPCAALGRHEQARTAWRGALDIYQLQGRVRDAARVQGQLDGLGSRGDTGLSDERPAAGGEGSDCRRAGVQQDGGVEFGCELTDDAQARPQHAADGADRAAGHRQEHPR